MFDALKGKVEMTAPRFKASAIWFGNPLGDTHSLTSLDIPDASLCTHLVVGESRLHHGLFFLGLTSPTLSQPRTSNFCSFYSVWFQDEDFVDQLASQMDALRGRELPGFMSAQSFYMFMAEYVEAWRDPARVAATEVLRVAGREMIPLKPVGFSSLLSTPAPTYSNVEQIIQALICVCRIYC